MKGAAQSLPALAQLGQNGPLGQLLQTGIQHNMHGGATGAPYGATAPGTTMPGQPTQPAMPGNGAMSPLISAMMQRPPTSTGASAMNDRADWLHRISQPQPAMPHTTGPTALNDRTAFLSRFLTMGK